MGYTESGYDSSDYHKSPKSSTSPGQSTTTGKSKYKPVKEYKAMLASRVKQLKERPWSLGLSESEKEQMTRQATQQATQQLNAQQKQINQASFAGQGFQAGEFAKASRDVGQQGAQAAAQARQGANEMSHQIRLAREQQIMAEMDAARERARQNAQFWATFALDATKTATTMGASYADTIDGAKEEPTVPMAPVPAT
jgi:hypothetical protein